MLCDSLDGMRVWGRMDTCVCMAIFQYKIKAYTKFPLKRVYFYMCVYMFVCMCMCVCVYIYIYIYIYIYKFYQAYWQNFYK